jgi:adenylosuccinate lyase
MNIYEAVVETELRRYLPFLMTTTILMEAVKRGVGRETAHEVIKEHAVAVSNDLRSGKISANNLLDRLGADPRLGIDRNTLQEIFDANSRATGMATLQVEHFVDSVQAITAQFPEAAAYAPGAIL